MKQPSIEQIRQAAETLIDGIIKAYIGGATPTTINHLFRPKLINFAQQKTPGLNLIEEMAIKEFPNKGIESDMFLLRNRSDYIKKMKACRNLQPKTDDVVSGDERLLKEVCGWINDGYKPPCYLKNKMRCEDCSFYQPLSTFTPNHLTQKNK